MSEITMHIGTKMVMAQSMTRQEYTDYRGWKLPAEENGLDEGYLIEYLDGAPNHPKHKGYITWSPKAQFDAAYRPTSGMNFGLAIEAMKLGNRVARAGWNGKGMWLLLVRAYEYEVESEQMAFALACRKLPWIGMKTADHAFVPWLASQTDMLADDWQVIE